MLVRVWSLCDVGGANLCQGSDRDVHSHLPSGGAAGVRVVPGVFPEPPAGLQLHRTGHQLLLRDGNICTR